METAIQWEPSRAWIKNVGAGTTRKYGKGSQLQCKSDGILVETKTASLQNGALKRENKARTASTVDDSLEMYNLHRAKNQLPATKKQIDITPQLNATPSDNSKAIKSDIKMFESIPVPDQLLKQLINKTVMRKPKIEPDLECSLVERVISSTSSDSLGDSTLLPLHNSTQIPNTFAPIDKASKDLNCLYLEPRKLLFETCKYVQNSLNTFF